MLLLLPKIIFFIPLTYKLEITICLFYNIYIYIYIYNYIYIYIYINKYKFNIYGNAVLQELKVRQVLYTTLSLDLIM